MSKVASGDERGLPVAAHALTLADAVTVGEGCDLRVKVRVAGGGDVGFRGGLNSRRVMRVNGKVFYPIRDEGLIMPNDK
jgi:hypothetical protein